ncbi:MAG: DUF2330 domain-containing protein [bacterium]|nr:DUF2330 domain-containing protein [bacterium]
MARLAPLAFLLAAMLSVLAIGAPDAHADGKVFLSIASDPSGSASATMPRQRAIIAFKDGEQRMAIDTSFVGPGEEFAWLVPLPSEPEILPATEGMFDTAAMITGPRVTGRGAPLGAIAPGVLIGAIVLIAIWFRARRVAALFTILLTLTVVYFWLPALGGSMGSPMSKVDVLQQQTVGVYDTAVLGGTRSDDVVTWLSDNGIAVPDGANGVIQDYLDRGWVFAAAKLRGQAEPTAERRAHPLQFRFTTERPVYPMALTAVGNESIALELFVFADGTASANGLEALTSFGVQADLREPDERNAGSLLRSRPVTIAHPGLVAMASELSAVTRLAGSLSARDQQQDIPISIQSKIEIDPLFNTPEARSARALGGAATLWIVCGVVWLLLASVSGRNSGQPLLPGDSSRLLWTVAVLAPGVLVGAVMYKSTPVYRGEIGRGASMLNDEKSLEIISHIVRQELVQSSRPSRTEVLDVVEAVLADEDRDFATGDSPLHYRIEFNEDETEARFIWHDLIGAEHRVVIPLVGGDPDDEATP